MNFAEINAVVSWIQAHPEHYNENEGDSFEGDSPAKMWNKFCANPDLVREYDDEDENGVEQHFVENGCDYIHS